MNFDVLNYLPLKSDRLYLIKTTIDDVDLMLKMDKQEETQKYLGGIKTRSREDRIAFLKKKEDSFSNNKMPLTVCLNDGTKIGFIGIKKVDEDKLELSYMFDYDYCNMGYCTEASKVLIGFGFDVLNAHNIVADTDIDNEKSMRVLSKLGFKETSKESKNETIFVDFTLTKSDYINGDIYE